MTSVIAPPPLAVLSQWSELVYLLEHKDEAAKLVKSLKAATESHDAALQAVAVANSGFHDAQTKLEKLGVSIDAKQAKLDKSKLDHDAKASLLATSESNLQGAYTNLESRTQEFEVYVKAKTDELAALEGKLNAEMEEVSALKAGAIEVKGALDAKLTAVKAAMGA